MHLYFFTANAKLGRVLEDGLESREFWTNPDSLSLTTDMNPPAPTFTDQGLLATAQQKLNGRACPCACSGSDFPAKGAIRVRVRVRREQLVPWGRWAEVNVVSPRLRPLLEAIGRFDAAHAWYVIRECITPNQIVRVERWSPRDGKWHKIGLQRRWVLA